MTRNPRSASPHVRLACLALCLGLLSPSVPLTHTAKATPSLSAGTRPAARRADEFAPRRVGELIVSFRAEVAEEVRAALARSSGATRRPLRASSGVELWALGVGGDAATVRATLSSRPAVEFVEPNYLITADQSRPDDPRFPEQWALANAGQSGGRAGADTSAALAWSKTTGSRDTVVAVIDGGVDFTHPDLRDNQWRNAAETPNGRDDDGNGFVDDTHGWDWVNDTGEITDGQGHGTSLAGLIAARGNNQTGIAGVMWQAGLMSLRVLDSKGRGDVASAVEAMDYAAGNRARVINCSWGTDAESKALAAAVARANDKGAVVVASAGNDSRHVGARPRYPAAYDLPNVISVASTDRFDELTSWSNWGAPGVTVAAPGEGLLTTKAGGNYHNITGTSASAALVSGVVGLIKTLRPGLKPERVRGLIVSGVRPVASLAGKIASGAWCRYMRRCARPTRCRPAKAMTKARTVAESKRPPRLPPALRRG